MNMLAIYFYLQLPGHNFGPYRFQHGERGRERYEGPGGAGEGRGAPEERHVHSLHHSPSGVDHHYAGRAYLEALAVVFFQAMR